MIGQSGHIIKSVEEGSIAAQLGIEPGDVLVAIDGKEISDILDYRFMINAESFVMLIDKPNGDRWELDIENDYEDPGLDFGEGLMSDYKSCHNKCIFCFIDQMPKGMRETLYFKDDDSRLSFLQGNYVTLTNMNESDIDRIIDYRMEPINISVHTTNPDLRCSMLNNRFAGESLKLIDKLYSAGVCMHGQIVLCPGWNDADELKRTLEDMLKWAPVMESVSVVPIGMTRYREGLCHIDPVDKDKAEETISIVEQMQERALNKYGIRFCYASDEFYLLADRALPREEEYGGYPQLENGVGMLRLLIEEVTDALEDTNADDSSEIISIATGELAAPILKKLLTDAGKKFPNKKINLYPIKNDFFGNGITVSGLITGQDIISQLKGKELGTRLLLPINMLRSGEEVFLDDVTKNDVEKELGVPVVVTDSSGYDLINAIRGDV